MNPTQQKSQIAKQIFEKIEEFKDWSNKLETIKKDYNKKKSDLNEIKEEYLKLDNGLSDYKHCIDLDKKRLKDVCGELVLSKDKIQGEINEFTSKIKEIKKDNITALNDSNEMKKSLLEKTNVLFKIIVSLDKQKKDKDEEIKKLKNEEQELNVSLIDEKNELKSVKQELLEMKDHIKSIQQREKNVSIKEERLKKLTNKKICQDLKH